MVTEHIVETDVLVVGGGMSGIFTAIKAAEEGVKVTLIDKGHVGNTGSVFFAEGFFLVFNPEWGHNLKDWMAEVAKQGEYINDQEWTEITLKESYDRYKDLVSWGVKFQRGADGELLKYKERLLWWTSDGPLESVVLGMGWTWLTAMRNVVIQSGAQIMDRIVITDLLKKEGRVIGAVGFHIRTGDFYIVKAKSVVVCTDGGIGDAMAYRAGATLGGKEWLAVGQTPTEEKSEGKVDLRNKQIKSAPLGGWDGGASHYIMFSHVDVEGNKTRSPKTALYRGRGPTYWNLDDASNELIDAVLREMKQGGTEFMVERSGFDLTKRGLIGGFREGKGTLIGGRPSPAGRSGIYSTDTNCATTLPGLYAAGSSLNNRTCGTSYPWWGFSLCHCSVTGARAGQSAAEYSKKVGKITTDHEQIVMLKNNAYAPLDRTGGFDTNQIMAQLRSITGLYYVSPVKHGERLMAALTLLEFLKNQVAPLMYARPKDAHGLALAHEAKSSVLCAEMGLRASLFRTESRGGHYREDYPFRDDPNWLAWVKIRDKDGEMELTKEPIPQKWWPDLSIPYDQRYFRRYIGEK